MSLFKDSRVFKGLQLNPGTYDIVVGCEVPGHLEVDRLLTAFSRQQ